MSRRGVSLFVEELRARPARAVLGLGVEYATYAAGVAFAAGLLATRRPLAAVERVTGWELRTRAIDLVARIAPG